MIPLVLVDCIVRPVAQLLLFCNIPQYTVCHAIHYPKLIQHNTHCLGGFTKTGINSLLTLTSIIFQKVIHTLLKGLPVSMDMALYVSPTVLSALATVHLSYFFNWFMAILQYNYESLTFYDLLRAFLRGSKKPNEYLYNNKKDLSQ